MMDFISEATGLIGACIASFLSLLLLFSGRKTNYLLGVLFFIYATGFALRFSLAIESVGVIYLPFIFFPSVFLYGPILFSYTSLFLSGNSISKSYKILSYFIALFILFSYSYFFIADKDFTDIDSVTFQKNKVYSFTLFLLFSGALYNLYFLIRSYLFTLHFQKSIHDQYRKKLTIGQNDRISDLVQLQRKITWIKTFTGINLFIVLTYAALAVVNVLDIYKSPVSLAEGALLTILVHLTLFYLIKKPDIFVLHENHSHDQEIVPQKNQQLTGKENNLYHDARDLTSMQRGRFHKYSKQALSEEKRKIYIQNIEDYMQTAKPYLDENFSIADLSAALHISIHHCSMTINIEKKMNFFNFVNTYRLNEAKKLFADAANRNETILNIAFRSGFQSKGAFNKAFKENEGITPREYKNRIQIDRTL